MILKKNIIFSLLIGCLSAFLLTSCSSPKSAEPPKTNSISSNDEKRQEEELQERKQSQTKEEPETETDPYAALDSFVSDYNEIANTPISDLINIDISDKQSEFYRVEFRLGAFKDAPSQHGSIGNSSIELINYGTSKKDSLRIYLHSDSYDAIKPLFETILSAAGIAVSQEELTALYNRFCDYTGDSFLLAGRYSGFYEKEESRFHLMIDFNKYFQERSE